MFVTSSNGREFQIDEADAAVLSQHRWYVHRYVATHVGQKTIYLHRLLMNPQPGLEVDHINNDKLDNRRSNLRVVTHSINERNKPARGFSKTGLRGVERTRQGRFSAYMCVDGKMERLGVYATAHEAHSIYLATVRERGLA